MASAEYTRSPPARKDVRRKKTGRSYINIWLSVAALDKTKQASAVVLTLEREVQDAALKIEFRKLSSDTGLEDIF